MHTPAAAADHGRPSGDAGPAASLAAWRRRATDVYSFVLAAFHVVLLAGYLPSLTLPLASRVLLVGSAALNVAAAGLRRLPVPARVALLVVSVWLFSFAALARGGVFLYFRNPLLTSPLVVLVLVGVRPGLAIGVVNLALVVAAFAATEVGWLAQSPPAWAPGEWLVQSSGILGGMVPQFLLLAWFVRHLADSVRREHETAARLRAEAADRERLESELLDAGERESRRIGNDLHDGVCQDLTGLLLRSKRAQRSLEAQGCPEAEALRGLVEGLGEAIGDVHALSRRLSPGALTGRDLAGALDDLVRRTAEAVETAVVFRTEGDGPTPDPRAALQLFRVAQEAVGNALRHAGGGRVEVTLVSGATATVLRVDDEGRGVPPDAAERGGLGLRTMRWRAGNAGGTLEIGSRPGGGGTRVECTVPTAGRAPDRGDLAGGGAT